MTDALDSQERATYERVWRDSDYRVPNHGVNLYGAVQSRRWFPTPPGRALDVGCGNGRLVQLLASDGWEARGWDIAVNAPDSAVLDVLGAAAFDLGRPLWDLPPDVADVAISCDVLEHLPPERVPAGLAAIVAAAPQSWLGIAEGADTSGPRIVGHPLHLCDRPAAWWHAALLDACPDAEVRRHHFPALGRPNLHVFHVRRD